MEKQLRKMDLATKRVADRLIQYQTIVEPLKRKIQEAQTKLEQLEQEKEVRVQLNSNNEPLQLLTCTGLYCNGFENVRTH